MRVPQFLSTDIRPAMLGARARVSGEKLNEIIREINRRNEFHASNNPVHKTADLPDGAYLSLRGEVLLRGQAIIQTLTGTSRPGTLRKIKEFVADEEITYTRLNEIIREVNRINGLPMPGIVHKPVNSDDCRDVDLTTVNLTSSTKADKVFEFTRGPLRNVTEDISTTLPDRVWVKYPEPLDSYELKDVWKVEKYKLLSARIAAFSMAKNSGLILGFGQSVELRIAFCSKNWDTAALTHSNAPNLTEFCYLPGNGICAGPFQPPNFGRSSPFPTVNAAGKNFIRCEIAPDFYRKYGVNSYFMTAASTRNRLYLSGATLTPGYYAGTTILVHQGFDDGTPVKIKSNNTNSFELETPLSFDPTPGDYIEHFPRFYGFFFYLSNTNFGGNNTQVNLFAIEDIVQKTYRIESDV